MQLVQGLLRDRMSYVANIRPSLLQCIPQLQVYISHLIHPSVYEHHHQHTYQPTEDSFQTKLGLLI